MAFQLMGFTERSFSLIGSLYNQVCDHTSLIVWPAVGVQSICRLLFSVPEVGRFICSPSMQTLWCVYMGSFTDADLLWITWMCTRTGVE